MVIYNEITSFVEKIFWGRKQVLRHNFSVVSLFVIAFSRLHIFTLNYLRHNSGWQAEKWTFPLKEKRVDTVKSWEDKHAQTAWSDTGQCGFETVGLTCLKLSMWLIIFLLWDPESWRAYQIPQPGHRRGSPLSFGMGTSLSCAQAGFCSDIAGLPLSIAKTPELQVQDTHSRTFTLSGLPSTA